MYARLILVKAGPGKRAELERVAGQMQPLIAPLKGFVSTTALVDDVNGEYGVFMIWESKEAADAAAAMYRPKSQELWAAVPGAGAPQIRDFEVYEPKG